MVPSLSPVHLVPVPILDRIAVLIGSQMPVHILQTEIDAECAAREVRCYRPLASSEDRADREQQLGVLAFANKVLAAYSPRLVLTSKRGLS